MLGIFIIICILVFYRKFIRDNFTINGEEIDLKDYSLEHKKQFFDDLFDPIKYTCEEPTTENEICRTDTSRACMYENREFCFITPEDEVHAEEYAFKKLCLDKGHCFARHPDGSYTCEFTKETCLASSNNNKNINDDIFTEEDKESGNNKYGPMYWKEGVGCITGTGIDNFRNYCETEHPCNMGSWEFDYDTWDCKITDEYCEKMNMAKKIKKNGDGGYCSIAGGIWGSIKENLFGKTVARSGVIDAIFTPPILNTVRLAQGEEVIRGCPPYDDVWGNKKPSTHGKIVEERCNNHLSPP